MNKKIIFSLIATVMITNFSFANLNVSEKTTTRFFLDNYFQISNVNFFRSIFMHDLKSKFTTFTYF